MRYIILIFFVLLGLPFSYAQTKEVCGFVLDNESDAPIPGVIVRVNSTSEKTASYTITDEKGLFSVKYDSSVSDSFLSFKYIGYKSHEICLNDCDSFITVHLVSQPMQLKDVIVKAPDIEQRSDTLTYHMSKWAKAEDKKLVDVLKRLPGIKVEDNGQINYNGEPINKFYIDGSDFLDGRYGIATENLNPTDVIGVDVYENHQPIQVLNGLEFSQQAGLNIKLKEEARRRWIVMLEGGVGGSPLLADASVFAMRVAGKYQNMETVSANNTGLNPSAQNQLHNENRIFDNGYIDNLWDDYINTNIPNSSINEKRIRDNVSVLANTSNSWHIGDGKDLKFNLSYESDKVDYFTGYETDYFDKNISSFIENNSTQTHRHSVDSRLVLQANCPDYFLKNDLYINIDWNKTASEIGGTMGLLQRSETPSCEFTNDFQLVKRLNNNLLTVSSRNRYTYKPHLLNVAANDTIEQSITAGDFRSVTESRYGWILGYWKIYICGGLDFNYHNLKTSLQGMNVSYPMQNDLNFYQLNTYISPEFSYKSQKWVMKFSVPANFIFHHIANHIAGQNMSENYVFVAPLFYVRRQINAKMDISAQFRYSLLPPDLDIFIPGVMLTDYRNLYLSAPVTEYKTTSSVTMNFKYRNPVTSLFFNLIGKYEWYCSPYMSHQLFDGNFILNTFTTIRNRGYNMVVNGSISKGLLSGRLTVGVDAGFARIKTEMMRQNLQFPYKLGVLSIQPNFKGYIFRWLSADYRLTFSKNVMDSETFGNSAYNVVKQHLAFTFVPNKEWQFSIGGEHDHTQFSTRNTANLILLDASVRWLVTKRSNISLIASNILNNREYRYTHYDLLSETEYQYRLRGRNILAKLQIRL